MKEHFVRLKVGMLEHVEGGDVTPAMLSVYVIVLWQADYQTGFWKGSAAKVQAAWCARISLRNIQRALEALCDQGYLKSFHAHGQRHNYPVAIHKYLIKSGVHKGYWLNASATTAPGSPVYALADDESAADYSDPTTNYVIDRDTTATSTAPNEGGVLARSQDTRELEKEFRGSQSQSPEPGLPTGPLPNAPAKSKAKSKHSVDGRLTAKLLGKIQDAGNSLNLSLAPIGKKPCLHEEERTAFAELEYEPVLDSPLLTTHFIDAVVEVVEENLDINRTPANLCSSVIDLCEERIKKGEPAYYPPDFVAHRNRLQKDQRKAERKSLTVMAAAAGASEWKYPELPRSDR